MRYIDWTAWFLGRKWQITCDQGQCMLLQIKCNQGLIRVLQINVTKDCRVFEITFLCLYRKTVGYYRLHVCVTVESYQLHVQETKSWRLLQMACTRNRGMYGITYYMYKQPRPGCFYRLHVHILKDSRLLQIKFTRY